MSIEPPFIMLHIFTHNPALEKTRPVYIAGCKEIIILPSITKFYNRNKLHDFGKHSDKSYSTRSVSQMSKYYFHHQIETFHPFGYFINSKRSIFEFILSKLKNHPRLFQLFVINQFKQIANFSA